jgi:hypothetical protein
MWVECPHCHCYVIPKENNICPSCTKNILDLTGATPQLTTIVLPEKTKYPNQCLSCCKTTKRKVKVGQKIDPLAWHPEDMSLWKRGAKGGMYKLEISPSVIVSVPQCSQCGKNGQPKILHIDYEKQEITLLVHKKFKELVENMNKKG